MDALIVVVFFGLLISAVIDLATSPRDSREVRQFRRMVEYWVRWIRSRS